MLYIITFTAIIVSTLGQTPPCVSATMDCSKYNVGLTSETVCCQDNSGTGDALEYANHCYAECAVGSYMHGICGKCCAEDLDCPGGSCVLNTGTTPPATRGFCYVPGGGGDCANYMTPCDDGDSCEYKGDGSTCVMNSFSTPGNSIPATTATVECPNCECSECGTGMYYKSCSNIDDQCQIFNANTQDSCGKCFSGDINNCPPNSQFDCNSFPGTKEPICCFSEFSGVVNKYSDICIAECSGEMLYYCGPCCDSVDTNPCPMQGQTCDFGQTGSNGVCSPVSWTDCTFKLNYEAPCDYSNPNSCDYRGVSEMTCVKTEQDNNGNILFCGQCQPIPTTTSSATTSGGSTTTTSGGATTTTSGRISTTSGRISSTSGRITTTSGRISTTSGGADTTATKADTTGSGTTGGGTTGGGTTGGGTTGGGTTGGGTTEGTLETCSIWGSNGIPFEIIEGACDYCFKNPGREKKCNRFVERVSNVASDPATTSVFNFEGWVVEQIQCFLEFCSLDCEVAQVGIVNDKQLPEDCGCEAFACDCECPNGTDDECTESGKSWCKVNDDGCNECVECLEIAHCPGETCNNNVCGNGNNSGDAHQIGVMVAISFVIGVFGWI